MTPLPYPGITISEYAEECVLAVLGGTAGGYVCWLCRGGTTAGGELWRDVNLSSLGIEGARRWDRGGIGGVRGFKYGASSATWACGAKMAIVSAGAEGPGSVSDDREACLPRRRE